MEKRCSTCKYSELGDNKEPCKSCGLRFLPDGSEYGSNWQPARSTRKELEAQLAALRQECEQYKAEREVAIENEELAKQQRDELYKKVQDMKRSSPRWPCSLGSDTTNYPSDVQQTLAAQGDMRDG